MKNHYNIVFEGKTVPGKEIDLVKKALMNILKADDSKKRGSGNCQKVPKGIRRRRGRLQSRAGKGVR